MFSAHLQAVAVDGPCSLRLQGKLQKNCRGGNFAPTPSTPTPSETFRFMSEALGDLLTSQAMRHFHEEMMLW